jgi:hypothetical protein
MKSTHSNLGIARALRLSQHNEKRVYNLFSCIQCGQTISVEKSSEPDQLTRPIAFDGLGERVHVCPAKVHCPYCRNDIRQSPRDGGGSRK